MSKTDCVAAGWGDVEAFRRERAARVARNRALSGMHSGPRPPRPVVLGKDDPVVVSFAAYRTQLATGAPQRLDYAGALVEWLRLGEGLSPESLEVAVTFMMGWPMRLNRSGATVLTFPR